MLRGRFLLVNDITALDDRTAAKTAKGQVRLMEAHVALKIVATRKSGRVLGNNKWIVFGTA